MFGAERKAVRDTAGEAANLLAEVRAEVATLSPQAQRTFAEAEKRLADLRNTFAKVDRMIEAGTDLISDADVIAEGLKDAPAWVKSLVDLGHRLGARAGSTLQGLFPLRISARPSASESALGLLLREPDGKAGSLDFTITPAHIPD